mgnify:CR=1 FL=1
MAWKPLDPRRMRNRIRIEQEQRTPNGQGGFSNSWQPLATLWAQKIPLRGDEIVRDGITRAVSMARFVIRHREDLQESFRLVEVRRVAGADQVIGTPWDIRRIDDPYGQRDRLELVCERGVLA